MAEAIAAPATPPAAPADKPAPATAPPAPDAAKLIAREQQRVHAQQKAKAELDAARAELAKVRAEAEEGAAAKAWRSRAKVDPEALKELYGDKWYDHLTAYRLSGTTPPEAIAASVDEKLAAFEAKAKAEREAERKALDARQAEQKAEAEREWAEDVTAEVKAGAAYRLINLHGAHGEVAAHIKRNYEATGKIASTAEAAIAVEAGLRKAVLDSIDDSLYAAIQASRQPTQAGATRAPQQSPRSTTLHSGITTGPSDGSRPLTRAEREARAIKRLEEAEARAKAVQ